VLNQQRPPVLFASLRGYRRAWLGPDLTAAAALLVIAIPEQLATARLAGAPPVAGLYAFLAGTVLIAALGASRQLSVGADSTIAPLFGVSVGSLATVGSQHYLALLAVLAVLVGAVVLAVGLLRLGWLAEFLSAPIISGFLAGVAVIIVVHQLPDLLGLPAGTGSTLHRLGQLTGELGRTSASTVVLAVLVLAGLAVAAGLDRRIPAALVAVVLTTVAVPVLHLHGHGIATLGRLAGRAPRLELAELTWSQVAALLPVAGVVALVVVSQTAATSRAFEPPGAGPDDLDRDFVAVGAGSVLAGLIGAFPVNASPPRTGAVAGAGGRSQLAGLVSAAAVAALIPVVTLLRDLPAATLAAVLVAVGVRIFPWHRLLAIARFDRVELALAVITLLAVALVGVQQGIGVAVALAILDRARLTARPQLHVLGRIPNTTSWAPLSAGDGARQQPEVLVVLFATPLWYANAGHFKAELRAARRRADGPVRLVVLDAVGMTDVDFTGAGILAQVLADLERDGIPLALARAGQHAVDSLYRARLLPRLRGGRSWPTVEEAVTGRLAGA